LGEVFFIDSLGFERRKEKKGGGLSLAILINTVFQVHLLAPIEDIVN